MAYKRERSYTVFVHNSFVFLDGLNNNIDVFSTDDFCFVRTLDSKERNLVCAAYINKFFVFGCQDRHVFIFDEGLSAVKELRTKWNVYSIAELGDTEAVLGERKG